MLSVLKRGVVMTLLLLLFLPLTLAVTEYTQSGVDSLGSFQTDNSDFNSDVTVSTQSVAVGTRPLFNIPKSYDFDKDGVVELVIIDGDSIEVYHHDDGTFSLINSYALTNIFGDLQIYDINNDGVKDIIIADGSNVKMVQFNGTTFNNTIISNINQQEDNPNNQNAIKCFNGVCGIAYNDCWTQTQNKCNFYFNAFNTTHNISSTLYEKAGALVGATWKLPIIPLLASDDLDFDGDTEFVFTVDELENGPTGTGDTQVHLYSIEINSTFGHVVSEINWDDTDTLVDETIGTYLYDVPSGGGLVEAYKTSKVSSPMIMNTDGVGNKEIIIGVAIDMNGVGDNDYKLIVLTSDLVEKDDYPEISNIEGKYLSNPVKMNCFEGSGTDDFFILVHGIDTVTGSTDEEGICGSEINTYGIYETVTYLFEPRPYNVSYGNMGIIHAFDSVPGGHDELITTQGVYDLDEAVCVIETATCNIPELIWQTPEENVSLTPIDLQNTTKEDLIGLGNVNIRYYDDGFTNSNAQIDGFTINPCAGVSTIKQNETIKVTVVPTDTNGDQVQAIAYLYYDEEDNQSTGWSALFSSGSSIVLSDMNANLTTASSTLRISVRDTQHAETTNRDITFTVGVNGVELGDCTYTLEGLVAEDEAEEEDEANLTETVIADNSVRRFTGTFADSTGLGEDIIFLAVMLMILGGVWYVGSMNHSPAEYTLGAMGLISILLFVVGVKLGLISPTLLITIMVIALIVLGIFIFSIFKRGVS